jgi:uncharacterized protein DUF5916/cellulose/xylan binding protein with CBM9 domain
MFVALLLAAVIAAPPARIDAAAVPDGPNAIRINGELSDQVWDRADAIDTFIQREPEEGAKPSQRTEFRVLYDASTLYVKVHAFDTEPYHIVGYLTRRDQNSPSDWIRVFIDSYHDRRTAYEFAVNPVGVKFDRYWYNDDNRDDSWDAVWDVKVSQDSSGWTAEFRIPFSQLRFTPSPSSTFGLAVAREIGRLNEISTWPLLSRAGTGYVSQFGDLGGLAMSASPKKLEIVPYTVANVTEQPTDGNPLVKGTAPSGAIGMDLKYALTPGLTLTATVNPDFGQVEADPAVVNLSAFETFFNERRPFFVEGSGTFRFDSDCWNGPCSMFYTRRVGRSPQGGDSLPSGDNIYTDYAPQTTILGAAKLTGKVGKFSIGVLDAVTQQEEAKIFDGGRTFEQPVEPLTNYLVGNARREFANQSSIGFMMTSTTRRMPSVLASTVADRAVAGGADFDIRLGKRFAAVGYVAGSTVRGDAAAIDLIQESSRHYFQRPDATSFHEDPTATSISGASGRIGLRKIGGQRVRFSTEYGFKTPGFDLNDSGFLRRADERWTVNWFQVRSETPNKWFRSRYFNVNYFASWNFDGDVLVNAGNINGNVNFKNNWSAGGGLNFNADTLDDRMTRGGPMAIDQGFTNFWSWLNTDNRKRVSFSMFMGRGWDGIHSSFFDHESSITYRPMSALTISTGVRLNRGIRDNQWAENVTDTKVHYVFGHLHQTTVALTERLNYTMTPNLSLQLYAEPFVSGGGYTNFRELVDGRNPIYDARYAPFAYGSNPDFNYKSFRTTNVLRWEYKPGSTLFVVWQQSREGSEGYGDFRFNRDFGRVFGIPSHNVVLVKLAYWLNY